ncbi:MAG: hypothetical protein JO337_09385 [Acidimicrobiales bacterium]|nr:hypothetical protein [Acidimicrobiales bacterium]
MPNGTERAKRFFEERCNQRRLEIAAEIMTADHRYFDPNVTAETGPEAMAQVVNVYQDGRRSA